MARVIFDLNAKVPHLGSTALSFSAVNPYIYVGMDGPFGRQTFSRGFKPNKVNYLL
jgi:hypothetical protein